MESSSNVGGFGIDGCLSTMIGSAMANKNKLFFGVFGDLSFFYDMNAITTPNIGGNVRIMLINNGRGTEFRNPGHIAAEFGDAADPYMAAASHFGNKSISLVKDLAYNLDFYYMSAANKEEYLSLIDQFVDSNISDQPMIFEVFTNTAEESKAYEAIQYVMVDTKTTLITKLKNVVRSVVGQGGIDVIKKVIR